MLKRLRLKFIAINMGIVLVMLSVIFGLVITSIRQNLERESYGFLQSVSGGRERRRPFIFQNPPEPGRERQAELPSVSLPYFSIELDAQGMIIGSEGELVDGSSEEELEALAKAALDAKSDSGLLENWGLRFLVTKTPVGTRVSFVDISHERSTLDSLLRSSLLIGGLSLAAFFFISLFLARWAVRPVEEAWKLQKQFVSDASHELKTPLTVIMTNAELLQSPDYPPAARERFGANILTMSKQMRGLVENLLELARVDNGNVNIEFSETDFSRVCEAAVLPFEPLCYEKGLQLDTDIAPGLQLRGSERHLRELMEILLDNAQKYANPDSTIRVSLEQAGRSARLCVRNEGPEIPAENLPHLFERFYRADQARGRDGSYGLGLAIAQKIVERHHGKIWAESRDGVNSFYVQLPLLS